MTSRYRPHWWMIALTTLAMILVQRWLWDAHEVWRCLAAGGLPFAAIKLDMYIWRKEQPNKPQQPTSAESGARS